MALLFVLLVYLSTLNPSLELAIYQKSCQIIQVFLMSQVEILKTLIDLLLFCYLSKFGFDFRDYVGRFITGLGKICMRLI